MATSLFRISVTPSAATDTTIYTVPASTKTVLANINICNRNSSAITFRILKKDLGATDYYLYYEVTLAAYDTFNRVAGDVLIATDVLRVRSSATNVDFIISGQETT